MNREELNAVFARYPAGNKDGLLPLMQEIQDQTGYLSEDLLEEIGLHLHIPANKVYCIATFFDQFRFRPLGQYCISLCRGTACHLTGSSTYLEEIVRQLKVTPGGTSKDRRFSLEITNCMGACDSAPVIRINETVHTRVSPADLSRIIQSVKEKIG